MPDSDLDGDGWSLSDGDCDDLDPTFHPDADDPIEDGLDQNCDGVDPLMRVAGVDHSCDLGATGEIICTGLESPEKGRVWIEIASGDFHSCALDYIGNISCWGDNAFGQSNVPSGPWIGVDANANYSIGLKEAGLGLCWGECPLSPGPEE